MSTAIGGNGCLQSANKDHLDQSDHVLGHDDEDSIICYVFHKYT